MNTEIELGEVKNKLRRKNEGIEKLIEDVKVKDKIDKDFLLGCLEIILND